MERYLGGEEIDQSVLIEDLEKAVARGSFFPVHPGLQQHRRRNPGTARDRHERIPVPCSSIRCPRCSLRRADRATA